MKRLLILPLLFTLGCGALAPKAPPNLTPVVEAKFYATYAIKDLDIIRDFANDIANAGIISKAVLLDVVNWHEPLVKIIHASPGGWKAATAQGLTELEGKLSASDLPKFKPYIEAARTFIKESL